MEEDDDKDEVDDPEYDSKVEIYNSMQERIRSSGLGFSKGAEPITIRNYFALWILLGLGYSTAFFSFFGEKIVKTQGAVIINFID